MKAKKILPLLNGLSIGTAINIYEELRRRNKCLEHGTESTPPLIVWSHGAKNMISYKAA